LVSAITPALSIDGNAVANGKPGPMTDQLREIYVDFAKATTESRSCCSSGVTAFGSGPELAAPLVHFQVECFSQFSHILGVVSLMAGC
jgi:hypothetical protein